MLLHREPLFVYTVRLSDSDREWLAAEAKRLREETGVEVTPSQVARRAIRDARRRDGV